MHLFYFHKAKQGERGEKLQRVAPYLSLGLLKVHVIPCVRLFWLSSLDLQVPSFLFHHGPNSLCAQTVNVTGQRFYLFILSQQCQTKKKQLLCCIWFEWSVSQRLKSRLAMNYKYELGAGFPTNCWEKVKHKVKYNQKENSHVKMWKSLLFIQTKLQETWENHVGGKTDYSFVNYKQNISRKYRYFHTFLFTLIIFLLPTSKNV